MDHIGKTGLCPICGEPVEVIDLTKDNRYIGSCGDAFTSERWEYEEEDQPDCDYYDFADPGGTSALRAERKGNPRNLPCPTCKEPNRLTPADRARGYQCDTCADREEGCY